MPIDKETVLRISRLARLDLEAGTVFEESVAPITAGASVAPRAGNDSGSQSEAFVSQIQRIVEYMDVLETADTAGVEPLYSPLRLPAPPRADLAVLEYPREELLRDAPEQADGFFVVPKVI